MSGFYVAVRLLQDLVGLLRELVAEVRGLRADLGGRGAGPQTAAIGELVYCISEQVKGRRFSVSELLEHAELVPELRSAIVAAVGALNGRKIGKLLRRIEGCAFDGISIVRTGADREGVSWVCEFQTRKPVAPHRACAR